MISDKKKKKNVRRSTHHLPYCYSFVGFNDTNIVITFYFFFIIVKTTENPLCVDNDNRCALYKDSLCHATAHTYVVATCAKTCNKCDEYIGKVYVVATCAYICSKLQNIEVKLVN